MPVLRNNEITPWSIEPDPKKLTASGVQDSTKKVQPKQDHRKFSLPGGIPQLFVTDKKITMSYKDNGLAVNENGTILKGKVHLGTDIQNIRINGFWVFNTELLTCLPSTLYTPMPVLKYETPPFAETVARLATMV